MANEATDSSNFAMPRISCVSTDGDIVEVGYDILIRGNAVRPVIWVDIDSTGLQFSK